MEIRKYRHIRKHRELHQALDELLADAIGHNPLLLPSKASILDLLEWSARQIDGSTIDHLENDEGVIL